MANDNEQKEPDLPPKKPAPPIKPTEKPEYLRKDHDDRKEKRS